MKTDISRLAFKGLLAAILLIFAVGLCSYRAHAESVQDDPVVVVSLGDSYSSGEGLGDYYGMDCTLQELVQSDNWRYHEDWLAHRSANSWPGQLRIPGIDGTLSDYKDDSTNTVCQWYFVASSGAETVNFGVDTSREEMNGFQEKTVVLESEETVGPGEEVTIEDAIRPQSSIFSRIDGNTVDYVTLTLGGNDIGFEDIMYTAAVHCSYLSSYLEDMLDGIDLSAVQNDLAAVYADIHDKAPNASVLIAGYPQLLSNGGSGVLFDSREAGMINEKVSAFNNLIEQTTENANAAIESANAGSGDQNGKVFYFVDVEDAFAGHGAYTSDAYINGIVPLYREGDLDQTEIYSAASFHPNSNGAQVYADCVNVVIEELEAERKTSIGKKISGYVLGADGDRTDAVTGEYSATSLEGASVSFVPESGGATITVQTDEFGCYYAGENEGITAGTYDIVVSADGYQEGRLDSVEIPETGSVQAETVTLVRSTGDSTADVVEETEPDEAADPVVVVSLGDSYSSGEGLGSYYGMDGTVAEMVENEDWIAHRSEISWPGRLVIPGIDGTLADYKDDTSNTVCQWYFVASSGATTYNFTSEQNDKTIYYENQTWTVGQPLVYAQNDGTVQPQFNVFEEIDGEDVDYVTLTIGGNNIGFNDIMAAAVTGSTHLGDTTLEEMLNGVRSEIDEYTRYVPGGESGAIAQAYVDIHDRAPNARIIIAGYPQLLNKDGEGGSISYDEATMINDTVTYFNTKIRETIDLLNEQYGEEYFYFADIEDYFNKDGEHGAYSADEWINRFETGYRPGDLDMSELYSTGSFHPNDKGAQAYADCVNMIIAGIEAEKDAKIYGTVRSAESGEAIPGASVSVVDGSGGATITVQTDEDGFYAAGEAEGVAAGTYDIVVTADGYREGRIDSIVVPEEGSVKAEDILLESEDTETASDDEGEREDSSGGFFLGKWILAVIIFLIVILLLRTIVSAFFSFL